MNDSMNDSMGNETLAGNPCFTYATIFLKERFYLVTVFGTCLASVSLVENLILCLLFFTRPYFRKSAFVYLTVLAVLDCLHSISYVLVMGVAVCFQYLENVFLMRAWYFYFLPIYAISHVVLLASVYLLVAMSVERYLGAQFLSGFCSTGKRFISVAVVLFFSLFSRGTVYFELKVSHRPNCPGLAEYIVLPAALVYNRSYQLIWCFWYRNIISVFLPFFLLMLLNIGIAMQQQFSCITFQQNSQSGTRTMEIRLQKRRSTQFDETFRGTGPRGSLIQGSICVKTNRWVQRAKKRVRKANTRSLMAIVLEYLVCTTLSVTVTMWEHIDVVDLRNRFVFWTFASDLVSLFTVLSCALRLPTYIVCDVTFRKELRWMILGILRRLGLCKPKRRNAVATTAAPGDLGGKSNITSIRQLLLAAKLQKALQKNDSDSQIASPDGTNVSKSNSVTLATDGRGGAVRKHTRPLSANGTLTHTTSNGKAPGRRVPDDQPSRTRSPFRNMILTAARAENARMRQLSGNEENVGVSNNFDNVSNSAGGDGASGSNFGAFPENRNDSRQPKATFGLYEIYL